MNISSRNLLIAVALSMAGIGAQAQAATTAAPAGAPAGTTVQCKDGSFASPATRSGACRGHHGIQTWYGPEAGATGSVSSAGPSVAAPSVVSSSAARPGAAPAPSTPAAAAPMARTPAVSAPAAPMTGAAPANAAGNRPSLAQAPVAPGGGPGKVWVNESSKVYHCSNDRYYGKTHNGTYMTEAEARAQGAHAAHNKACS